MIGRVLVAGLGLIGGSIALSIKRNHPKAEIMGYDIQETEREKAVAMKIVSEKAESFEKAAERADLIIMAAPVEETEKLMEQLSRITLKKEVTITDTGSTKGKTMRLADHLWPKKDRFIGGHPMAGSHQMGIQNAKSDLFENARYIFTPQSNVPSGKIDELMCWLSGTNAHFLTLDPEEHDYVTGIISHFPHIIAAGLANQAKGHAKKAPLVSLLAAGGFRDTTRIASSNPYMWKEIVKQNRNNLLSLLQEWQNEMNYIQSVLMENDDEAIVQFFEQAKEYRDSLPEPIKKAVSF
ncbi:prephenate dehydrogenase [Heyndrickxia acidicola]|uniref:Prephenate dehydrogenase n=1 Tax=Heyndrickxia acidicola TaxID=209389 RepID=A0ABU6MH24_9BACI|nr:prephenate dehydrogenase [Heyndrickxia acidicola]MED1203967.1 prephenate dehydrogenase [Heyndrickxia acidicola]